MSQIQHCPQSQEEVIDSLVEGFPQFSSKLQIAARYIIDHPHEVGVQTMRTLAGEAGVHPNSFVRLARQLGFEGYDAMRERFRDFVRSGVGSTEDRISWLQEMETAGGSQRLVGEMYSSMQANLEQMVKSQDSKVLEESVESMLTAERVFVLGLGSAYPLAYNFWYLCRMVKESFILIPRHGSLPLDDLVNVSKSDLLFAMTFQPYRKDVISAQKFVQERGAKTIGLSDSPTSTLYRESDIGLHVPTHTPHFFHSNSAVAALLEVLCAMLVVRGGSDAVARVRQFTEMRWQSGVYDDG